MKHLALDCLMLASLAGLCLCPLILVGSEPWRPLVEALVLVFDYLGIPLRWY